jgi:hypothetical protein
MKNRNLATVKVKLPDLLYLTIVHVFILARHTISINTYNTILMRAFLILLFGVERVSIYVVPLIRHNGKYRAMSQLFQVFTSMSIRSRSQPVNFLMCSFANHDSLRSGLSLSNTSLCSSKYSNTMDIRCNTWK